MIKIKKVKLTNFLSYGAVPTEINFENPGTTLMIGKNGVGKTSIINALVYGLYDKPISQGINKDDLVNNINKRRMEVVVDFEIGNHSYTVVRARKMKVGPTGNYVKIYEGKKDITPDSVHNANNLIIEIIGIDYELFVRIVTFAATHEPFLNLPVHSGQKANQTDIIEELFNLKTLSDKADLLKEKIKDNNRSLKTAENEMEFKKKIIDKYDEQIHSAQLRIDQWNNTNNTSINIEKKNLVKLKKINIKDQKRLLGEINKFTIHHDSLEIIKKDLENDRTRKKDILKNTISHLKIAQTRVDNWLSSTEIEIETIIIKIDKVKDIDVDEEQNLHNEISKIEDNVNEIDEDDVESKRKLKLKKESLKKKQKEISHLKDDNCPYCHQTFPDAVKKLEEINAIIKTHENEIKEFESDIKKYNISIKNLKKEISTLKKKTKVEDITELVEIKSEMEHLKTRLGELQHAKNPHVDELEERKKENKNAEFNGEFDKKIKEKGNEIKIARTEITALSKKLTVTSSENLFNIKKSIENTENKIKELEETKDPHQEAMDELRKNKPSNSNMNKINLLNEEITHQKFLYKILTKKDSFVRKALLDKNIPYLNKQLSFYLNELGLPFAVEFTHEMTANITSFGNEISFANMSAGQKSRINLALSFAFRDVLQNLNDKINVCIMDEVLDVGLDIEGVQIATTMLKNRALSEGLSMFVVSHKSDEIDIFDKRMIIEMDQGFSKITYE